MTERTLVSGIEQSDRIRIARVLTEKTATDGACAIWTGPVSGKGYGVIRLNRGTARTTSVHRAAWILANGPIADARLVVDHLCRNRLCVLPQHLELITTAENTQRGWDARKRIVCGAGHALTGSNLREYTNPRTGHTARICRECRRLYRLHH